MEFGKVLGNGSWNKRKRFRKVVENGSCGKGKKFG